MTRELAPDRGDASSSNAGSVSGDRPLAHPSLAALEKLHRQDRIRHWLDDVNDYAEELGGRLVDGELASHADNEWVWMERGRLLEVAQTLLREVWLAGLERDQ